MHEQEWTEVVDDEQKRAFIYGIGMNDKNIKNKNEVLLEHVPNELYADMSPLLFILLAANMNTLFRSE